MTAATLLSHHPAAHAMKLAVLTVYSGVTRRMSAAFCAHGRQLLSASTAALLTPLRMQAWNVSAQASSAAHVDAVKAQNWNVVWQLATADCVHAVGLPP